MTEPLFSRDALSYKAGDVVAGRYRITGVVGRGGFGAVYAAEHTGTQQAVALKMLTTSGADDTEAIARFYREARITAGLSSPHTVRVFDVDRAKNGPLFIAMELLKGPTLEQVLKRLEAAQRIMSEQQTLQIAISILSSLAEAHAAGLVHRDLKPANVILSHVPGSDPVVKVLDFGCSRTVDSDLTLEGTVLGTPGYMSPEQCRGEAVDGRSDLYALGVISYRCTTGRLPFESEQPLTLIYKHASEPVPDPRTVSMHEVSETMAALLMRALEKTPDDRFHNARKMRQALRDASAHVSDAVRHANDTHTQIQGRQRSRNPLSQLIAFTFDEVQHEVGLDMPTVSEQQVISSGDARAGQTLAYAGGEPAVPPPALDTIQATDAFDAIETQGAEREEATELGEEGPSVPVSPTPLAPPPVNQHANWKIAIGVLLLLLGAIGVGLLWGSNVAAPTDLSRQRDQTAPERAAKAAPAPLDEPVLSAGAVPKAEADLDAAPPADTGAAADTAATVDAGAAPMNPAPDTATATPPKAVPAAPKRAPRKKRRRSTARKANAKRGAGNIAPAKGAKKKRPRLRGVVLED